MINLIKRDQKFNTKRPKKSKISFLPSNLENLKKSIGLGTIKFRYIYINKI